VNGKETVIFGEEFVEKVEPGEGEVDEPDEEES